MNLRSIYVDKIKSIITEIIDDIEPQLEGITIESRTINTELMALYSELDNLRDTIEDAEDLHSSINTLNLSIDKYNELISHEYKLQFNFIKDIIKKIYYIISNEEFDEEILIQQYSKTYDTTLLDYDELKNRNFYINTLNSGVILLLCPKDNDNFDEFIESNISSYDDNVLLESLVFMFSQMDVKSSDINEKIICITDQIIDNDEKKINILVNYISLIQIYLGKTIHSFKESTYNIALKINSDMRNINKYTQYKDIMHIVSEFNEKTDILDKYTRLYQVIENFMYKMNICKLVNENTQMFTIREFKILYENVKDNEETVLKNFFKEIINIDINQYYPGKKMEYIIKGYIDDFKNKYSSNDINKINNIMKDYKLVKNINLNINNNDILNKIASVIYKLRNTILHNKETEKHINNNNIPNEIFILIDDLIIPILVEIIFYLIFNDNELVDYNKSSIPLYID